MFCCCYGLTSSSPGGSTNTLSRLMLQNRGKPLLGLTQTLLNINYLLKETNKQEAELLTGINNNNNNNNNNSKAFVCAFKILYALTA